ncbi:transcription factor which mediates glucose repression [Scheffersomyces coipomensis]|uniref:transcription factor which mediates glucose repression n=1 Tax=Scheffersomyces coipomensis TaxID=1788519 RepID=UPI00315CA661
MVKRQQELSPRTKRQRTGSQSDFIHNYESTAADTWIACGNCANTLGLIVPAIKAFERAVNHDPSSLKALCGLSYSLRLNDINLNETVGSQNSIERLNKSLELYPELLKDSSIFKELAECYLLIGLNDQAHQSIQTAIQLSQNDASLWLLSAQTLIRVGARNHAAGSLTHCLSILPESLSPADVETARAAHAELAAIAAADGSIELSIAELTATLSLPPPPLSRIDEHIALWCALSTAKERANDIPGAIQACENAEKAVGNSPRILMTHSYLLLLNQNKGDADLAIELLSKIIDLEKEKEKDANTDQPNNDGDFLPWYLLGKAYSLVDQPRLAYDSYQVALRRASNSPITWLAVGKLYLELKQLPDALAAYSQALRLQIDEASPGTATAWDGLSCVYERCDEQLSDAADACSRSASCFRAISDTKNAAFFEERATALSKAFKKEGPIPALRDPPDVPSFFLRDLVALLPSERIAFIQGSSQTQPSAQEAQQQAQQQQQQQLQSHDLQQTPQQRTPVPPHHSPAVQIIQPHQTPQQVPVQAFGQHTPFYGPQSFKQEQKSPHQLPPQLPPPHAQQAWSPNQQPQYFYQAPMPLQPQVVAQPPQRSPMTHQQVIQGGGAAQAYAVAQPPPPGYAYGQYVPVQGGVIQQQYAAPVNNWRR